MLRNILTVRVNLALIFLGAFTVMLLIKLTSLLPSQYYFSFSKIVAGDRGPFLIDPPSVSGQKLCELLRKNRISAEELRIGDVDCSQDTIAAQQQQTAPSFSAEEIDAIYNSVLVNAGALSQRIQRFATSVNLTRLSEDEFRELLADASTIDAAVKKISWHYKAQIRDALNPALRQDVEQILSVLPDPQFTPAAREELTLPPLNETEIQRLLAAHDLFLQQLDTRLAQAPQTPIRKSDLDGFLENTSSKYGLAWEMTQHHTKPVEAIIETTLQGAVSAEGLALRSDDEIETVVFAELSSAGLWDYATAVLIRLGAVLLFGVVAGIVFGRHEFVSIAVAAALAAFLLSWPLMLMWDRLVVGNWNDQRPLFLLFYAIYIVSFYITARFGAVIGALLRRAVMRSERPLVPTGDSSALSNAVTFRDFVVNLAASVAINVAVYATNIVIPLTAAVG